MTRSQKLAANGRKGGLAAGKKSKAFRKKRASNGGTTTLKRYGKNYFEYISRLGCEARRKKRAKSSGKKSKSSAKGSK